MLDFHSFVDRTNERLVDTINAHDHNGVWVSDNNEHVEWRSEAFAVRLLVTISTSSNYSFFRSNQRCGPVRKVFLDDNGISELVEAIIDHASGRNRIYQTLTVIE